MTRRTLSPKAAPGILARPFFVALADPIVAQSIGELKIDPLPLQQIAKHRKQASALVDKVGFDR